MTWYMQQPSATKKNYSSLSSNYHQEKRVVKMKLNKTEKLQKIQDEVEELITSYGMKNHHYLLDEEIIAEFSMYKKKHVKKAINNLR
jgi:hypothetical protein